MKLYLIRHAEAEPHPPEGSGEDADRRLTPRGIEQARRLGTELPRRGVELDLVLSSPFVRARQTAMGMLAAWPSPAPPLRVTDVLTMWCKKRCVAQAVAEAAVPSIALVGHEPDLTALAGWVIGFSRTQLAFEKAGVACFNTTPTLKRGCGTLLWLVTPDWLTA